jgi:hypothetical protein
MKHASKDLAAEIAEWLTHVAKNRECSLRQELFRKFPRADKDSALRACLIVLEINKADRAHDCHEELTNLDISSIIRGGSK